MNFAKTFALLVVLFLIIGCMQPTDYNPQSTPTPKPQTTETTMLPAYSIDLNLASFEVEKQAEIGEKLFGLMQVNFIKEGEEIGAKTNRVFWPWYRYQNPNGTFNDETLVYFSRLQAHESLITIEPTHKIFGKYFIEAEFSHYGVPKNMSAWDSMISHLAAMLSCKNPDASKKAGIDCNSTNKVKYWQIGNEWLWQWKDSPEEYFDLINHTRELIKKEDPGAKMISGSITGAEFLAAYDGFGIDIKTVDLHGVRVNEQLILDTKKKLGFMLAHGKEYVDVLDFHLYSDEPHNIPGTVNWINDFSKKNAGKTIEIWSLEHAGPMEKTITEQQFSSQVLQRYALSAYSGVKRVYWSSLTPVFGWSQEYLNLALVNGTTDKMNFTLTEKKPAFYTYKLMAEKFAGKTKISKIKADDNIYLFELSNNEGNKTYIAWARYAQAALNLKTQNEKDTIIVTHIISQKGQTAPKTKSIGFENGIAQLSLSSEPVFFEINKNSALETATATPKASLIKSATTPKPVLNTSKTTNTDCTDSDGGINYSKKGTAAKGEQKLYDYCVNNTTLIEYSCLSTGGEIDSIRKICEKTCINGTCK